MAAEAVVDLLKTGDLSAEAGGIFSFDGVALGSARDKLSLAVDGDVEKAVEAAEDAAAAVALEGLPRLGDGAGRSVPGPVAPEACGAMMAEV